MSSEKVLAFTHGAAVMSAGFDPQWVGQEIDKYGEDVLHLLKDGIALGFSKDWLTELVQTGTSDLVGVMKDYFSASVTQKQMKAQRLAMGVEDVASAIDNPLVQFALQQAIKFIPGGVANQAVANILLALLNSALTATKS